MRKNEKTTLYKGFMTAVILALATLLSLALQGLFVRAENIIMVYIVALLIIIIEFKQVAYGLGASVCIVLLYQFLFTEPKYAFRATDYNDWFVAIGIFVVEIVVSTLVTRMRRQMERSERNERRMEQLFSFSNGILAVPGKEILSYGVKTMESLTGRGAAVVDANGSFLSNPVFFFEPQEILHEIAWCDKSGKICGAGENRFPDLSVRLYPLRGASKAKLGVLALDCSASQPDKEETAFLLALASQLTVALDRETARQSAVENDARAFAGQSGSSDQTEAARADATNASAGRESSEEQDADAAIRAEAETSRAPEQSKAGAASWKDLLSDPTGRGAAKDSPVGLTQIEQAAVIAYIAQNSNQPAAQTQDSDGRKDPSAGEDAARP